MEAKQCKIVDLFSQTNTQFAIPVYQRDYNWEEKQCKLLLEDIIALSQDPDTTSHFVGSIVYIHEGVYTTGTKEFSIIDGQQRLTTLTLLFLTICHRFKELNNCRMHDKIFKRYIVDEYMDRENSCKLILPEENLLLLGELINGVSEVLEDFKDRNIIKNYKFFQTTLQDYTEEDLNYLMMGIEKLIYVDIALEKDKDDPQKIFESLNSTGLDLSQGDLIRNLILMNLDRNEQTRVFKEIWTPIEINCRYSDGTKIISCVSDFIRDYLTLKNREIFNKAKIFEIFKQFYLATSNPLDILNELKEYSEIYSKFLKPDLEKDKDLRKRLKYLRILEQRVINPLLLGIFKDYRSKIVPKNEILKVLDLLESYIWRRYITGEPSKGLNTIFMVLHSKINPTDYYTSFAKAIVKHKFPRDEELKFSLLTFPIYKNRAKLNYVFEKIENYHHNELIDFENEKITIEHIFPQNPGEIWKVNLSSSREFNQMQTLKDTLPNLTLTGSNSSLGNKSFLEKRDAKQHGYKNSKLHLNKWLGEQEEWNLSKLNERFEILFKDILAVWQRPTFGSESEEE